MLAAVCLCLLVVEARPTVTVSETPLATQPVRAKPSAPARRPLDEYPAFVRPFLKYGVGGMVGAWFLAGIYWLCRRRWSQARTEAERRQAVRWITGMLLGVVGALLVVAVGLLLWLRSQHLLTLFLAGPAAVLLPPLFARLLAGSQVASGQADRIGPLP